MKTIGVLTFDFYPFRGGIGRHIYDVYYQGLNKEEGFNVKIISPCENDLSNNLVYYNLLRKNNKLGKNISFSFLISPRINSIIKREKIDILNVHAGPGGIILFSKPRVKTIVTAHHTYFQQISHLRRQWWKRAFIPLEKRTYQLADKIIAVSLETKNVLINNYGIPQEKITVIPNCINTKKFKPLKRVKILPKSLLYVGRLDKRKGIDWLLKTMAKIVIKDPEIKLYIGGEGKLKNWISNFIDTHDLNENVKLLGFIPDNELNEWYNKAEVFIMPSRFEGFGITALEAVSTNTKLISTPIPFLNQLDIVKNKFIYIVEYEDENKLINSVFRMLSVKNDFSIYKKIRKRYSKKSVVHSTKKIYTL
jgi:glycosyltransferase involved in cell wall biosynthesis